MRRRSKKIIAPPLSYTDAKAVVASIKYKPDWIIKVQPSWLTKPGCVPHSVDLQIMFTALDSINQEQETYVFIDVPMPLDVVNTEDKVVTFVREAITQAEAHERDEWLRYKGELLDDPHGPGRNGKVKVLFP